MTYPFVHAKYDYGVRSGPVKAFLIHMAEGGGTVAYLAGSPLRGVSVHYVIEYSGRIVRMLDESHASGSVNPQDIRTTDDANGFYGVTAAKAVMDSWWKDPNAAVISLEIEGFAKDGPNADQQNALAQLVTDVWSRYPGMGLLGHRDFADYKQCPGTHIDWARLGGHGPAKPIPEEPMGLGLRLLATTDATPLDAFGTAKVKGTGHSVIRVRDRKYVPVADGLSLGYVQKGTLTAPLDQHAGDRTSVVAFNLGAETHVALLVDVSFAPTPPPPAPDCTAAVHAGVKAAVNGTLDVVSVALSSVVTTVEKARVA
jgi:hypothetical protein